MRRYIPSGFALLAAVALITILPSALADAFTRSSVALSNACMWVGDAARVHSGGVAVMLGATATALLLLAASSAVVQLIRTARLTTALRAHRADSLPPRVELLTARLGLRGLVDVVDAPEAFAFCHGLRHPKVMLSTDLVEAMPDDELEAVLRHEAEHVKSCDPLRIVLARTLAVALAFVPLTPGLLQAYLCRRELDADRASVDAMADARPLASALHRMLSLERRRDLSSFVVGSLSATDLRIDQLLGEDISSRSLLPEVNRLHVVVFGFVLIATLCVLISTAHAAAGVPLCLCC